MINLNLEGEAEIQKVLNGLPLQLHDKFLRESHVRSVRPLEERAHLLAPVFKTGNLAESIGVVKAKNEVVKGLSNELGLINVGPRRKGKYKGYHAHLVEHGTDERTTRRGKETGRVKPEPFMKPAWDQTQTQVLGNIKKEYFAVVDRFIRRTLKK